MDDIAPPDPASPSSAPGSVTGSATTGSLSMGALPLDPPVMGGAGGGAARLTPPAPSARAAQGVGWRTGVALGILAFLGGVAVMALVAVRFGASFGGARPVAMVTVPVEPGGAPPVVIVPSKTAAAVPALDLAALSRRETELAAQLADLEARGAATDRSAARASGYATRAEGLMVAFAARRALDRGLGLGFIEGQLRARFGDTQPRAVATIVQAARDPVTLEDLRAGLDGVAPELMTGAASSGWWASFRRELGTLIVLRRAGTPSPLPVDRVARARRLLAAGQVEAALAEVARMPGAARADGWIGAARRYIGARTALDTIESTAIAAPEFAQEPTAGEVAPAPAPAR